ncbi:hypothetical protein D5018_08150 [Parashewanella curva]|uniref:Uncharacterized protein n=1 Tax=Parashewanella curva TaxID=2338552 RepID=A0A3L8PY89_9GAMM|nr:hypothetical protein [Parashewanella curva]RLV60225.1 hypothetical protein D5018_08150 [Parashewanella curva]
MSSALQCVCINPIYTRGNTPDSYNVQDISAEELSGLQSGIKKVMIRLPNTDDRYEEYEVKLSAYRKAFSTDNVNCTFHSSSDSQTTLKGNQTLTEPLLTKISKRANNKINHNARLRAALLKRCTSWKVIAPEEQQRSIPAPINAGGTSIQYLGETTPLLIQTEGYPPNKLKVAFVN